jgi:ADP-ribosyl-[dinitrogen reductase] hydrolase
MRNDAELVTRITHGSPASIASTAAVAHLVRLAARSESPPEAWPLATAAYLGTGSAADSLREVGRSAPLADLSPGDDAANVVATAALIATRAGTFSDAVFEAVNFGGPADARGAIAGAIAGARWGIAGISQPLIDSLEGRIYISLAAPWFYRVVLRRAGLVIDLRAE